MKREKAEWAFDELLAGKPDGVETESVQLDADTIVLQIKHPSDLDLDNVKGLFLWIKKLKKTLPSNVYVLASPKDLDIDFQRPPIPQTVHVEFRDCAFRGEAGWNDIVDKVEKLRKDTVEVHVTITGCTFYGAAPAVSPPGPTYPQSKVQTHFPAPKVEVYELHKALSTTPVEEIPRAMSTTLGRPPDPESAIDKTLKGENDE